jgi:hypothetical protein
MKQKLHQLQYHNGIQALRGNARAFLVKSRLKHVPAQKEIKT